MHATVAMAVTKAAVEHELTQITHVKSAPAPTDPQWGIDSADVAMAKAQDVAETKRRFKTATRRIHVTHFVG